MIRERIKQFYAQILKPLSGDAVAHDTSKSIWWRKLHAWVNCYGSTSQHSFNSRHSVSQELCTYWRIGVARFPILFSSLWAYSYGPSELCNYNHVIVYVLAKQHWGMFLHLSHESTMKSWYHSETIHNKLGLNRMISASTSLTKIKFVVYYASLEAALVLRNCM